MDYKRQKVSTGSFDFNKWLYGGYEKGIITMFVGPPGSGKTNFTTLVACSQARKGKRVIFIDTEGGFSVERVKQLVGRSYESVLDNIILFEPRSFSEQKQHFKDFLKYFKTQDVGLVIVDSISLLYRLEIGDQSLTTEEVQGINRDVAHQMRLLSEIARDMNIPVLITNQVYSGFLSEEDFKKGVKREIHYVGGDLFKYWSKCIVELKMEKGKRSAFLFKHRSLQNKFIPFYIKDEGIFKRGWI